MATHSITLENVALIDSQRPNTNFTLQELDALDLGTPKTDRYWLLFQIPENQRRYMRFKSLSSAKVRLPYYRGAGYLPYAYAYGAEPYTVPVTWATRPTTSENYFMVSTLTEQIASDHAWFLNIPESWNDKYHTLSKRAAKELLEYGAIAVHLDSTFHELLSAAPFWYATEESQAGAIYVYKPELTIEYVSDSSIVPVLTVYNRPPQYGYTDPSRPLTFAWTLDENPYISRDIYYYGDFEQVFAYFYWKTAESDTYMGYRVASDMTVTFPANYFPKSTISWYIECHVDGIDTPVTSVERTFTTIDSWSRATPQYPVSTIVESGQDISFQWSVFNPFNNPPTAADLQYMPSGGTWTDLGSVTGDALVYTVPVDTLPVGSYQWRVRSYNLEGDAGSWSTAASFILLGAPDPPGVTSDEKPFATISWQSTDQQAYQISIDGKAQAIQFGDALSYQMQEPLSDGWHVASVSVQNAFGLWSEPGAVEFIVENVPGNPVQLAAAFDIDARLVATVNSDALNLRIYRDDKLIGAAADNFFTDRFVLGQHSYYVLNVLPGGYYTKSNVVTGTMKACTTVIDTLQDPSGWMELRLTANDPDEQIFSYQRTASLRHFTGSVYPVLELAKYEDGSGTYDVAFPDLPSAQAFEALKGKVVIIKSRGGNVVIGALLQLQKRVGDFFVAYDFTVQRIAWEDFVDDQNG